MIKISKVFKKVNGKYKKVDVRDIKTDDDLENLYLATTTKKVFKLVRKK
jgi:hypothetical protein